MQLIINDSEKLYHFKTIFQYLKAISTEINLDFTSEGLYAQSLGANHVCLVEFNIGKDWFTKYDIEKSCSLGINCEVFHSILSCLEKENSFELNYDDGDTLNIKIICENVKKQFDMRLMVIDSIAFDIPDVEYSADITINSKSFADYITELSIFGDNLLICCDGNSDNVSLETSGDNGTMNLVIDDAYMEEYAVEEDVKLELNYAMSYIKKMVNFEKLNNNMALHLSKESPLKITYKLSEAEDYLNIYLAPKMDD
tara:strand:- start:3801 stop:4565 length:765 start_codon:yes stop_codon:yes gene_type:complete